MLNRQCSGTLLPPSQESDPDPTLEIDAGTSSTAHTALQRPECVCIINMRLHCLCVSLCCSSCMCIINANLGILEDLSLHNIHKSFCYPYINVNYLVGVSIYFACFIYYMLIMFKLPEMSYKKYC